MTTDTATNASLAQEPSTVLIDRDVVATPEDLDQVRGMAADLMRLAVLPTAVGYVAVHLGRRAARMMAPDRATRMPHSIPVAVHDFAVAGRDLLAGIVDSGLPLTLLVALIAYGAARGLRSVHAPVAAAISWSTRAVMPPFFLLVTVAVGAHLVVPHWLLATPVLAYLLYVAVLEVPLIRRALRQRGHTSEAGR